MFMLKQANSLITAQFIEMVGYSFIRFDLKQINGLQQIWRIDYMTVTIAFHLDIIFVMILILHENCTENL